ncbi:uncharacterized protein [Mycetomoellerius zeteki]|nr:PREDICTED: uncharacterized protein LOC108729727 isoform X2 [Trachymyrmex zeteki]
MWEKPRSDGKRILKCHATPNIFEPCLKTIIASKQNTELIQSVQTVEMNENSNLSSNDIIAQQEESIEFFIVPVTENQPNLSSSNHDDKIDWKKKYEKLNDLFKKREKMYNTVLRKCNCLNNTLVKRLNTEKQNQHKQYVNTKLYSIITKVFTNDQIKALTKKSTRGSKWSEETLKKAVRLRITCGANGYKELLQQHIPLPSLRTLQEKMATLHFEQGICKEILNILKEK